MGTLTVNVTVRMQATCGGTEAQLCAREPTSYGAGWPEMVGAAQTIFVYESEPHEPRPHFWSLLAYDAEGYEVGPKKLGGWERSTERSGGLGAGVVGD
jgi:hypothetical protein